MDTQLKKGLIDVCILKSLNKEPSYGYKIISDISSIIEVSESTLYPILRRLENSSFVTNYKEEHNGRLRKYYKITQSGKGKLKNFKKEYNHLLKVLEYVGGDNND